MKVLVWLLSLSLLLSGCAGENAWVPTGDGLADGTRPPEETTAPAVAAPGQLETQSMAFTLAWAPEEGLNPYTCTNLHNRMLFSLVYQSLFTVSAEYEVQPQLCARSLVSEDKMSHSFWLAEATFSDGTVLTAMDVVQSLEAARENPYYAGRFLHIGEIAAAEENTVTIQTTTPMAQLSLLLDIPIVKYGQEGENFPQGTGPYALQQGEEGLCLVRRQNWWCDAALPIGAETIGLLAIQSPTQIRDAFEFGNLDISIADPGSVSYAAYRSDYELWDAESGILLYVGCNSRSSVLNKTVRAALTYAIDRMGILTSCYNGFGIAATLAASPNCPSYDRNLAREVSYDPGEFTKALTTAGMVGRQVRFLVNKSDSIRLQAAWKIAQTMTDCGLVVELVEVDGESYQEALALGDFDLYLGQTRLSPNMDLSEFFREGGALRYGGMKNEKLYEACLEALEDPENLRSLHQQVLENGQLIPVLFRTYAVCAQRNTTLTPSRDNIFYYEMG